MECQDKKVSIVVPVYNGQKFIENCLKDLVSQDYSNLEILVVDDGSTDNSLQICQQLSKNDSRIKVLSKINGGTGSALNLGFKNATGEYQTWCSCDDSKEHNYVSKLVEILDKNEECEFVFSDHEEKFYNSNNKNKFSDRVGVLKRESGIMNDFINLTYQFCITGVCFMFTKNLKQAIGEYTEIPGEDYIMGAKMGMMTNVYYLNECLGAHILHDECLTLKIPGCTREADKIARTLLKNYMEMM